MQPTFIFFVELFLGVILWTLCTLGLVLLYLDSDSRWRHIALRNRRRHPDLLAEYERAGDEVQRFKLAQRMLVRDRGDLHNAGREREGRYPDVWDYYVPTSQRGRRLARRRRRDRLEALKRLRRQAIATS